MEDAVPETQYEYVDAGDGDADVADDAALEAEYVAAEPVEAEHRVVEIEADAFSIYGICYTVDYEFNGFVWRMNGGSSIWLSRLLARLNADFGVEDVREATFSDPALLAVTYDAEERDWYLSSLTPFTSEETLTLTLLDGEAVEIRVTDTQDLQDIEEFLTEAEFLLDGVHVGGSSDPDPMEVRTAHIYRLSLVFQEEEEGRQFPDSGGMIYELPEGIDWRLLDGTVTTFDIVLGKKDTLYPQRVDMGDPGKIGERFGCQYPLYLCHFLLDRDGSHDGQEGLYPQSRGGEHRRADARQGAAFPRKDLDAYRGRQGMGQG
ncbi:MAG: hypothetical protein IJH86_07010 [Clostridia bacterium]|nr:hypothetical protein [Clostridia bacterium]